MKDEILHNHSLFIKSVQNPEGYSQRGVIRTNCMDCLDRTNVMQAKISLLIIKFILKSLNDRATKHAKEQGL